MIHKVTLKNFKLHASTEIEAAPITVFIGPNNSGKSSIFQALLSLRQAAALKRPSLCEPDFSQRGLLIIDIGEFGDVVRQGERDIRISAEGTVSVSEREPYGPEVKVEFEVWVRDNRLAFHKGSLSVPVPRTRPRSWIETNLAEGDADSRRWVWEWRGPVQEFSIIRLRSVPGQPTIQLGLTLADHFGLLNTGSVTAETGFPPERQLEAISFQQFLVDAPRRLLASIHPIFPLRGWEAWGYPLGDVAPENLFQLGLKERAEALVNTLVYRDAELERLSKWLEELHEPLLRLKFAPGKRVVIRSKTPAGNGAEALLVNEGTGANQLPFILIPVGLAHENETILLWEPEAHLHPRLQSELTRLVLRIAKNENKQFFIETHSEHVLHALLHAVARGELGTDDLAIYFFENIHGEAKARRLKVNDKGQVEGGLPGFFDKALEELSEYLDALRIK